MEYNSYVPAKIKIGRADLVNKFGHRVYLHLVNPKHLFKKTGCIRIAFERSLEKVLTLQ